MGSHSTFSRICRPRSGVRWWSDSPTRRSSNRSTPRNSPSRWIRRRSLRRSSPRQRKDSPQGYADDLAATGRRLAAFASILEEPAEEADRLRRDLLYAEASQYILNEGSGRIWIEAVNDVIDRAFSRLAPDTSRVLTFTSRSGTIPLRMGDPGGRVLNVRVELASGRVEFLGDNERTVRLDQPDQVITFRAEVKASGPSQIVVRVMAPNGMTLTRGELLVSSTAVNPIALIITIGAGLVLVGLWSRRLFRRRNP